MDVGPDVKVRLFGLWAAMLFVFAYVDIFAYLRADVVEGVLAHRVAGSGFAINQAFLVYTTAYVLVPSLMILVSLLAPARVNQVSNVLVSLVYAASVVVSTVGETWAYYIVGSVVEVLVLLAIAYTAWTWPRRRPYLPSAASR